MSDILAISLNALQQDMARLDRISMNVANATTPGYKRTVVSALPMGGGGFEAAMLSGAAWSQGADRPAAAVRGLPGPMSATSVIVQTDDRPGSLKSTSQGLDVALDGPGFFEVRTDAGVAYTRGGGWQLDPRGRLVTNEGHPVMGVGGEIVLTRPNVVIDPSGQIFERKPGGDVESAAVGQLKVVRFEGKVGFERLGNGLLQTDATPLQVADARIRQGFLENSNVNSLEEMAQLIQSMRHFEAMQRVAQGYDEMIGAAVRKLGDLS
ncbi:flagellar basal-body rod protein FlgG [Pseudacidovorax sp. 1753]|uniref:flagellar hook-basal body protein n=1 Tax=Pseudacidovorax sp. 1753 TaxID=3156419 RepID=UPI003399FB43